MRWLNTNGPLIASGVPIGMATDGLANLALAWVGAAMFLWAVERKQALDARRPRSES